MSPRDAAFSKPERGDDEFEFQLPDTVSGRGRIPKGPYMGRLVGIKAEISSNNNPMWVWSFVITKGPYAGRDFNLWTVLTDDAAWKIIETMKALGEDAEPGDKIRVNKKKLIGTFCQMNIIDDVFNGSDTSKLGGIGAHPNGAGYRGGLAKKDEEEDEDETVPFDRSGGGDDDDDEVPPPPRTRRGRGRAAPSLGAKKGRR